MKNYWLAPKVRINIWASPAVAARHKLDNELLESMEIEVPTLPEHLHGSKTPVLIHPCNMVAEQLDKHFMQLKRNDIEMSGRDLDSVESQERLDLSLKAKADSYLKVKAVDVTQLDQ